MVSGSRTIHRVHERRLAERLRAFRRGIAEIVAELDAADQVVLVRLIGLAGGVSQCGSKSTSHARCRPDSRSASPRAASRGTSRSDRSCPVQPHAARARPPPAKHSKPRTLQYQRISSGRLRSMRGLVGADSERGGRGRRKRECEGKTLQGSCSSGVETAQGKSKICSCSLTQRASRVGGLVQIATLAG